MSVTYSCGKVGITPQGTWSSGTAYDFLDLVTYNGSSYLAVNTSGVTAGTSLSNTSYWLQVVSKGDTGVGIASVTQTTTSTADEGINVVTVTLEDGTTSTFNVQNGSQGSTGATGNGIQSVYLTGTSGLVDTYTILFTDGTTTDFTVTNGADGEVTAAELQAVADDVSDLSSALINESATGNPLVITDGADDVVVKDCSVAIEPSQSGSGDPTPNNIRPISGWTQCDIVQNSKNLIVPRSSGTYTANSLTFVCGEDGSVKITGTSSAVTIFVLATYTIPTTASSTSYTLTGCPSGGSTTRYYLDCRNDNGSQIVDTGSGNGFTSTGQSGKEARIIISNGVNMDSVGTFYPMLRESSTSSTYQPYVNETYSVDLSSAGTVYGGTLDVTTGVLTVTHSLLDLGSLTWEKWPNLTSVFRYALPSYIKRLENSVVPNWKCEIYTVREGTAISSTNYTIGQIHQAYLLTRDTRYTDATAYKSAMNGKHLCYELATPQTYQLTPTEVTTLLQNNVLTCNCGDITLSYYADTKTYIDEAIATAINSL